MSGNVSHLGSNSLNDAGPASWVQPSGHTEAEGHPWPQSCPLLWTLLEGKAWITFGEPGPSHIGAFDLSEVP